MFKINKYTLEQFKAKYEGQRHISCGVNYADGTKDTFMNTSYSVIISYIKNKEVVYIASK